jgi:dipeptidyl aminopeptidase/acylaminoacyl peptidase
MAAPNKAWKERFRAHVPAWSRIAREAPARGLVCGNYSGTFQLHAWDVPSGQLRQLTNRPSGIGWTAGTLSPDGRFVYYHDDTEGNEIGHYVRIPYEGGGPQDVTPGLTPYASWTGVHISCDGKRLAFVGAASGKFSLHTMDAVAEGAFSPPRLIAESATLVGALALSYGGELAVIASAEKARGPQYCLVAYDTVTGKPISELWDGADSSIKISSFASQPGDLRTLATTDRSGAARPLIWNPRSGERLDLELPQLEGEVLPQVWSPDAKCILLLNVNRVTGRLFIYDIERRVLRRAEHAGGTYWAPYYTLDGEIFVHWQDSRHPLHLVALDGESGALRRTVLPAGSAPEARAWKSITFPSGGGQEIQAWLLQPEGTGPHPTILETHGGPQFAMLDVYLPPAQAWLDRGFAYLTVNYRGSTTFGRTFERTIWGNPGHAELEDMVAAREFLIRNRIARPDAIFLTGWSYGGYLTLLGLGKTPELWAGGMAGIAIADWNLLYEDSADTLRAYQVALFGGGPNEKREQYLEGSPITYAERVRVPLLVIQGRNDTRCPARQMEVYMERMKALEKQVEIHWFDAGHGSLVNEQRIEHQELMMNFAQRVLEGGAT